jgi:hypothetical protein
LSRRPRALPRTRRLLYEKVFSQRDWPARVAEVSAKVRAAMTPRNAGAARELAGRMDEFRTIVGERVRHIAQQLAELPEPLTFDKSGAVRLTKGWATKYERAPIWSVFPPMGVRACVSKPLVNHRPRGAPGRNCPADVTVLNPT